jgi:hypothetical protein
MKKKPKWPTLAGRLENALRSQEEAVRQLKACGATLSPEAIKLLDELDKFESYQRPPEKQIRIK